MIHSWPEIGSFGFGKVWKATILRKVRSAESVSGAKEPSVFSNFFVKVAAEPDWTIKLGKLNTFFKEDKVGRFSASQVAPAEARVS